MTAADAVIVLSAMRQNWPHKLDDDAVAAVYLDRLRRVDRDRATSFINRFLDTSDHNRPPTVGQILKGCGSDRRTVRHGDHASTCEGCHGLNVRDWWCCTSSRSDDSDYPLHTMECLCPGAWWQQFECYHGEDEIPRGAYPLLPTMDVAR